MTSKENKQFSELGLAIIKESGPKVWEIEITWMAEPQSSKIERFYSPGQLIYYCNYKCIRVLNKGAMADLWTSNLKY